MTIINGRILYLLKDNTGILFDRMSFFCVDLTTGRKNFICKFPVGEQTEFLSRSRILSRLKRLEPKCAGRLSETEFVVSLLRCIWLVDIENRTCKKLCDNPEGFSEVINFCSTKDGVYWGDYGRNDQLKAVTVNRLQLTAYGLQLNKVYTFEAGKVRHIHNIVEDGDGFLMFVGDNEEQAGIYRVNSDWTEVKPWKIGQQKYRAVVGWPYQGGVFYATGSVETENQIRYITAEGEEKELAVLNGSCIYGCETKDYYLFSTTVEPHEGGGKLSLLFEELGGGIKSRDVTIVAVRKKDLSVRQVANYRKDSWPMKLFQYGRCIFAGGQQDSNTVWCSPVACKKYDGTSIELDLNSSEVQEVQNTK